MKKYMANFVGSVLALFGLITLFMSSSVIFDLYGIRAREGNFVPFVVWSNFACSLFYLPAAYGFLKNKKWTALLLFFPLVILIVAFIGLKLHIKAGLPYETRTIGAMVLRTTLTLIFILIAYLTIPKKHIQ